MPRFSDKPLRWAPVPGAVRLTISVEDDVVAQVGPDDWGGYEWVEAMHDFHCVTTWSRLGNLWEGVSIKALLEKAEPLPEAEHVVAEGYDFGWTTSQLCVAVIPLISDI